MNTIPTAAKTKGTELLPQPSTIIKIAAITMKINPTASDACSRLTAIQTPIVPYPERNKRLLPLACRSLPQA